MVLAINKEVMNMDCHICKLDKDVFNSHKKYFIEDIKKKVAISFIPQDEMVEIEKWIKIDSEEDKFNCSFSFQNKESYNTLKELIINYNEDKEIRSYINEQSGEIFIYFKKSNCYFRVKKITTKLYGFGVS